MKRSAYLYRNPTVYFHGRVFCRLADLQNNPHVLTSLAERETNPVRIELGIIIYFIGHSEFITGQCKKIFNKANKKEINGLSSAV